IMQAYLASRFMRTALVTGGHGGHGLLEQTLARDQGPSRELLLSLVFLSRDTSPSAFDPQRCQELRSCIDMLLRAAQSRDDTNRLDEKALDLYAAALEIDCVLEAVHLHSGKVLRSIVDPLLLKWTSFKSVDG